MQAGIELSDDEGDLDPYEDDLAVRGKGGRKTGGRQTGTADAAASAQQLHKVRHLHYPHACMFTLSGHTQLIEVVLDTWIWKHIELFPLFVPDYVLVALMFLHHVS